MVDIGIKEEVRVDEQWSEEEDLLLAREMLTGIRKGDEISDVLVTVSKELEKEYDACSFRWNKHLKQRYKNDILIANSVRELAGKRTKQGKVDKVDEGKRLKSIIETFDEENRGGDEPKSTPPEEKTDIFQLLNDLTVYVNEKEKETKHNLEEAYDQLKEDYEVLKNEHETMIQIFSKAKTLIDKNAKDQPH